MCRKNSGFTLVELAVAMAVSGLCATLALTAWLNFRAASLHRERRYQEALQREASLQALQHRLTRGAALVRADETTLEWRDGTGANLVLDWEDSLTWDGKRFLPAGYTLRYVLRGYGGATDSLEAVRLVELRLQDSSGTEFTALLRAR